MQVSRRSETSRGFPLAPAGAAGPDAQLLADRLLAAIEDLRSTRRHVAFEELFEAFEECGHPGWDGCEALPISADVFATARDFLFALPNAFPSPEVSAGEGGEINLDWFPGPQSNFTVAVLPDRRLIFASVAPNRRLRGAEVFEDRVPDAILTELRRVF